jgi:hypothetical protein
LCPSERRPVLEQGTLSRKQNTGQFICSYKLTYLKLVCIEIMMDANDSQVTEKYKSLHNASFNIAYSYQQEIDFHTVEV